MRNSKARHFCIINIMQHFCQGVTKLLTMQKIFFGKCFTFETLELNGRLFFPPKALALFKRMNENKVK